MWAAEKSAICAGFSSLLMHLFFMMAKKGASLTSAAAEALSKNDVSLLCTKTKSIWGCFAKTRDVFCKNTPLYGGEADYHASAKVMHLCANDLMFNYLVVGETYYIKICTWRHILMFNVKFFDVQCQILT